MDLETGGKILEKKFRPLHTQWRQATVNKHVKSHKRRSRRVYKQYLKTQDPRDLERSQRMMTRFDFD